MNVFKPEVFIGCVLKVGGTKDLEIRAKNPTELMEKVYVAIRGDLFGQIVIVPMVDSYGFGPECVMEVHHILRWFVEHLANQEGNI